MTDNRYRGGYGRDFDRDDDRRRGWQEERSHGGGYDARGQDRDDYRNRDQERGWSSRDQYQSNRGYAAREHLPSGRSFDARRDEGRMSGYGQDRYRGGMGRDRDEQDDRYFSGVRDYGDSNYFRESYGGDRHDDRDDDRRGWSGDRGGYSRHRDEDRGWLGRAADSVRSWARDDDDLRYRDRDRGMGPSAYGRDRDWRR